MVHDSVLYTHHMHGQVRYIWLTEYGYFGLSMVLWFFFLIVYIYVHLKAQEEKQKLRYPYSIICSGQGFHTRSAALGIQLLYSQVVHL